MHSTVMNIDRMSIGKEMPSSPRWYRELMTSIQDSLTPNCIVPARS